MNVLVDIDVVVDVVLIRFKRFVRINILRLTVFNFVHSLGVV